MKHVSDIAHRHRRIILTASAILWVGAMIATHIPVGKLPHIGLSDKLAHSAGYFVLAGMFWLTLWAYRAQASRRAALVFFVAAAYAAVDEITQPLARRNASFGDWIADVVGAVAALVVCELLVRMIKAGGERPAPKGP